MIPPPYLLFRGLVAYEASSSLAFLVSLDLKPLLFFNHHIQKHMPPNAMYVPEPGCPNTVSLGFSTTTCENGDKDGGKDCNSVPEGGYVFFALSIHSLPL